MKPAGWNKTIVVVLGLGAASPGALPAQTHLLLFRDGRVLVRQTLPIRLPAGRSLQRFSLDEHDPGSLVAIDSGVAVVEALYPHIIDHSGLLRRAVGRRLVFRRQPSGDTVSALVLSADPFRFELPGGVSLNPPGDPLFPADLLGRGRTVEATFESARPLERVRVGFVTDGITWAAQYSLLIRGATAVVSGNAALRSSALTSDSAEITLLDGMVNRAAVFSRQQPQRSREDIDEMVLMGTTAGQEREPTVRAVGGVHLYDVAGRHSIQPGMTSVVQLFRPTQVPVERIFTIQGALPPTGNVMSGATRQPAPVQLRYRLSRSRGSPFGSLALPTGMARLYAELPGGRRVLIGEASMNHVPAGADLDLLAGQPLDMVALREDGETQMAQDSVQRADGGVNVRNAAYLRTYKVTFTNRSDSTETVEVVERRAGSWSVVSSSVPAERLRAEAIRFRVVVPARGEAVLTYRLRIPTR